MLLCSVKSIESNGLSIFSYIRERERECARLLRNPDGETVFSD